MCSYAKSGASSPRLSAVAGLGVADVTAETVSWI
jgi:hypothetical protein